MIKIVKCREIKSDNYRPARSFPCPHILNDMHPLKTLLWLRFASFIMDMAFIYCLSILLQPVIWKFTFIAFSDMLAVVFAIYYTVSYILFAGQTPAKLLTGLQVKQKDRSGLTLRIILVREVLLKGICGLLIPLFLVKQFVPCWSVFYTAGVSFIVLFVTVMTIVLFKRTWWELLSGTLTIQLNRGRRKSRSFLYAMTLVTISAIAVMTYPLFSGKEKLMNSFSSRYPVTKETERYASFIKSNGEDPVDYIFHLFEKNDIVVISERLHPEYTQYDLIFRIVNDERFAKEVGNIFTECGSVSFQDTLTSYLHTSFRTEDELDSSTALLQRNSNAIWPIWSNSNLFDFFKTVNKLNVRLPDSAKINWYFTGPPVDWQTMTHEKYLRGYNNLLYDSIMAGNIISRYKTTIVGHKRHKALIIMNSRHGYGLPVGKEKGKFASVYLGTTGILMQNLPREVANVMINTVSLKYASLLSPIQNGKWDKAFEAAGNPDVGFDFAGSPLGNDNFDAGFNQPRSINYSDVFTGFIFYKPLENHITKDGFPYMFNNFEDTIIKRAGYVSEAHTEMIRRRIARYQQDPQDPVDIGPAKYAILYNIVNVIVTPILLLICLLIGVIFFIRLPQK